MGSHRRSAVLLPGRGSAHRVIWEGLGTQNICLLLKLIHKLHFPMTSAWAQWVHSRASLVTLKGDIHGEHWEALRSLLPLYQAITTVKIGNGTSCSFWLDVWHGDEALADRFPALFSHCTAKDASINEMISTGIRQAPVPRLSTRATCELQEVQDELANIQLISDHPLSARTLIPLTAVPSIIY